MTVLFEKRRLGAAPALIARPSSVRLPLPTVLWFHGFTAGKATHRPELAVLAEAGFLAVGIDAAGHGERRLPDFEERFSGTKDENDREFYALVAETAAEVPGIVDLLCRDGLADEARIGAAGVSMGGMITYGAVAIDPRIRAAVALLATPEWPHSASPHLEIERFFPTALFSITAERDEAVAPAAARSFHAELEERYRRYPERLRYVELAESLHMMTPADWAWSIRESVEWLSRFTADGDVR
jgi:dienelactone hydrolase